MRWENEYTEHGHSHNTRNSYEFRLPFCRTRIKQFFVFSQGPKYYNTLNTHIVNSSSPFSYDNYYILNKMWEKVFNIQHL